MDLGSMYIQGGYTLHIEGTQATSVPSENGLTNARATLARAKSSRSPIESQIAFLEEWIAKFKAMAWEKK